MTQISVPKLIRWMLQEEWRLHKRVVGNRSFVGFPLILAALTSALLIIAARFNGNISTAVKLIHLFVFGFGLHMGNIALTGRDAIEDLLGGITFLVYSSRTMPVATPRLVGVFLLKDVVYYAWMVTIPVALGFLVALPAPLVGRLALSLTFTFMFGLIVALLGVDVLSHGAPAKLLALGVCGGLLAAGLAGVPLLDYTPYALFTAPNMAAVGGSLLVLGVGAALGVRFFSPNIDERLRVVNDRFQAWRTILPTAHSSMAAKTLLDVNRSNGGLIKLLISASMVFGVSVYLFQLLETRLATEPLVGTALGALLALEGFLVYAWMVRFDSLAEYAFLPVTPTTLIRGKTVAFTLVALPMAVFHYALSLAFLDIALADMLVGLGLLVTLLVYFFGVTMVIARLAPHEQLVNPVRFLAFLCALFTPLGLVLREAFTTAVVTQPVLVRLGGLAVVCLAIGGASLHWAATRWEVTAP